MEDLLKRRDVLGSEIDTLRHEFIPLKETGHDAAAMEEKISEKEAEYNQILEEIRRITRI
ncbi:MAG: hypothetical protein WC761_05400 [Candidatus Paceibacterota bacterium]|jgi:hypothetical protein